MTWQLNIDASLIRNGGANLSHTTETLVQLGNGYIADIGQVRTKRVRFMSMRPISSDCF
jgi:hypothetical protein